MSKNDSETCPYFAILCRTMAGWQRGGRSLPRMSKKRKQELAFFLNERGRIAHNDTCRKCVRDCKQSFKPVIVYCHVMNPSEAAGESSDRNKKMGVKNKNQMVYMANQT